MLGFESAVGWRGAARPGPVRAVSAALGAPRRGEAAAARHGPGGALRGLYELPGHTGGSLILRRAGSDVPPIPSFGEPLGAAGAPGVTHQTRDGQRGTGGQRAGEAHGSCRGPCAGRRWQLSPARRGGSAAA